MREYEQRAVVLYTMMARDVMDFFDELEDENDVEAVDALYKMLTASSPNQTQDNRDLNEIMAPLVLKKKQALEE